MTEPKVIEIVFYSNHTILIFDDGHEEEITQANTNYIQEELN